MTKLKEKMAIKQQGDSNSCLKVEVVVALVEPSVDGELRRYHVQVNDIIGGCDTNWPPDGRDCCAESIQRAYPGSTASLRLCYNQDSRILSNWKEDLVAYSVGGGSFSLPDLDVEWPHNLL